jgi:hypothetical protein
MTVSITKSSQTGKMKSGKSDNRKEKSPSAEGSRLAEPAQKRETETAV